MTIVLDGGSKLVATGGNAADIHRQDELKLAGRHLEFLPAHVCSCAQLKILDVSDNRLGCGNVESLTSHLSGLRNLVRLNLSANELKTMPSLDGLPLLEVFCASGNELEYLDDRVSALCRLKRFHCDFNLLKSLPSDWSPSLVVLSLSNNRLEDVPATLWTLQRLEVLDLRRNRISNLGPLPDGAAQRLGELRLSGNRIAGSLDLTPLSSLTVLDVSENYLEHLDVSKLKKLETLIVSHNALKRLEVDGAKLRSLQADANDLEDVCCQHKAVCLDTLSLSHNNLKCLPEWISEAKSLALLSAEHNQISSVPKNLFTHCHLRNVRLTHNLLVSLPELLTPCHVRSLWLQYNRIEQLPENFFLALPCLETLNLSFNSLQCLPPSYGTNTALKSLFLSGNRLTDLSNLSNLLNGSRVETLYLACNGIEEFPEEIFSRLLCLKTLSLSGNGIERVSSHLVNVQSLQKLYLHSNRITSVPVMSESKELQVLDLACNNLHRLELASIVPKDLTYLDLSANPDLQIDPADFQHLCCQRSVAVVDVNCAGRRAPLLESPGVQETDSRSPWLLGFTESQDGQTRLYVEFQREQTTGKQEALVALMELEDRQEVGELRNILPDLLKAERERNEICHNYLKNALLSCVRLLRSRNYMEDFGITMCHLSSAVGCPVTLMLGTVGRPSSCVLGRAGEAIVLDRRPDTPSFGIPEWNASMEATEVCCSNYLGSSPDKASPKGPWSILPEPDVRELVLCPRDQFLLLGDSAFSGTVPADEVCRQMWRRDSPVAAAKALAETRAALADGRRECVAVVSLRSDSTAPHEEEVEKYRCWEFMLEQNHKLLFTKELETIHKTALHDGDSKPTVDGEMTSWYTTALSKYKCPLPSHRGRYYCYGSKAE